MFIYTVATIISCCFARIASEILYKKQLSILRFILACFVILLSASALSFLAGARDLSVGTDTLSYGIETFRYGANGAFSNFSKVFGWFTPFTQRVMWWIAHNTRNLFIYWFWLNLFYTLPVVFSCVILTKRYSWVGVFIFGVFLFAMSTNAIRQCMAMGPAALALCFTIKKKPILFILSMVLAILIHPTAIVFVVVFPIYYYLDHKTFLPLLLKGVIVATLFFVFIITFEFLLKFIDIGQYYAEYAVKTNHPTGGFFTIYLVFLFILWSSMYIIFCHKDRINVKILFLLILFLAGIILFALAMQFDWLGRLGFYFWIAMSFLPQFILCEVKDQRVRIVLIIVFLVSAFFTGYLYNDIRLSDKAVPYIFAEGFNFYVTS